MFNDNKSHLDKNLGTLEPEDKITAYDFNVNERLHQEIDYSDCFIPCDDEPDYDDLLVSYGLDQSPQPALTTPPTPTPSLATAVIDNENSIVIIDQKYLGDEVKRAFDSLGVRVLTVKSSMKSGKTTAAKMIIDDLSIDANVLFVTPRSELNRAIASELGFSYYKDVLKERDLSVRDMLVKKVVTTPNSLNSFLKDSPIVYDFVFIDESETASSMLTSSVTKNKALTLKTLCDVVGNAKHTALMDAHAGTKTKKLAGILAGNLKKGMLINKYKSWDDYSAEIITSTAKTNRNEIKEATLTKLALDDIRAGKATYICSSSKEFCNSVYEQIKADSTIPRHMKDAMIIMTTETKDNDNNIELLKNPDLVTNYKILIGSPSVAVGVSFTKHHFHNCYGHFAPNNKYTGEPDDAIQALGRARNLINKKWIITLAEKEAFRSPPATPDDIIESLNVRITKNISIAERPVSLASATELQVMDLYAINSHYRYHSKNNYPNKVLARFNEMGITVTEIKAENHAPSDKDVIVKNIATRKIKITKNIKTTAGVALDDKQYQSINTEIKKIAPTGTHEQVKEKNKTTISYHKLLEKIGVAQSRKLNDEEYELAKANREINPHLVDDDVKNAMDRYIAEKQLLIDFDDLDNVADVNNALSLLNVKAHVKCMNREIAQADAKFVRRYTTAMLVGIGANKAFKKDAVDDKLSFNYKRKLYKYALSYKNKSFTDASLKRSAFQRWVIENKKILNDLQIKPVPANFNKKPSKYLIDLIESIGLKIESSVVKNRKTVRQWTVKENVAIEALLKRRKDAGSSFVDSTTKLMDSYTNKETDRGAFCVVSNLIKPLPVKLGIKYIEPIHVVTIMKAFGDISEIQKWSVADKFVNTAQKQSIDVAISDLKMRANKIKKTA